MIQRLSKKRPWQLDFSMPKVGKDRLCINSSQQRQFGSCYRRYRSTTPPYQTITEKAKSIQAERKK